METQRQVLIVSIGPVQQFIAQARKTRDLWFGSFLLSELSKQAAMKLEELDVKLLFPYKASNASWDQLKVANKIVGIVTTGDPKSIALEVRRAVVKHWIDYADTVKEELGKSINPGIWDRQITDFIEFFAVWSPIVDQLQKALEQAESLMAARKTLRDFKQNEPGVLFGEKKSSLDGGRESVFYPDRMGDLYRYGIKKNETLDAISTVKRLSQYIKRQDFPSVCDIAFLPFRARIDGNEKLRNLVDAYYSKLREKFGDLFDFRGNSVQDYESALFYENRISDFVEERVKPHSGLNEQSVVNYGKQMVTIFNQFFNKKQNPSKIRIAPPPTYYAFLVCDGDRIGQHLRSLEAEQDYRTFARHLSRFASLAERIVKKRQGQLVYSGGDDIMAYLPLRSCLQACYRLHRAFTRIMKLAVPKSSNPPTLSFGLAIVHMLERLGEVRELARQAEETAKQRRNELAIFVHKRHGGTKLKISLPFDDKPVHRLLQLQEMYRNGLFSAKLAYELRELHMEYVQLAGRFSWREDTDRLRLLLRQETERLIVRKKPNRVSKDQYQALLDLAGSAFVGDRHPLEQLRQLAEQMIIAAIFVAEGEYDEQAVTDPAVGSGH